MGEEPDDFDAFWARSLEVARGDARDEPTFRPVHTPLRSIAVDDVTFAGFGGHPIRGWFLRPADGRALPTVVEFLGYGGGRSLPTARIFWPSVGYGYLVIDSRGQDGDTPDPAAGDGTGHQPGFVTQGIDGPETYYYRRLFVDAVRAVEDLSTHPAVDAARVIVAGHSQGGATALAVAGLSPIPRAALIDAPFLCDIRGTLEEVADDVAGGYREVLAHLAWRRDHAATVYRTLAYVDGCSFAARATAPARFSIGLRDRQCPPASGLAAYDRYAGPKALRTWLHNGHELGMEHDDLEKVAFLRELGVGP